MCGITRPEDAEAAVFAGADAVGVVFAESPRNVDAARAEGIARAARAAAARCRRSVLVFGLFVNEQPETIRALCKSTPLDVVQMHGEETVEMARILVDLRLVKAVRLRGEDSLREVQTFAEAKLFEAILLDAFSTSARGGTGKKVEMSLAARAAAAALEAGTKPILAGGLTPYDVATAIEQVRPFGVDVSSGVEMAPGVKDYSLIDKFISAAKGARWDFPLTTGVSR